MLNISVLQVHIHADSHTHRYTDTLRYPTPVPKAVLRCSALPDGERAGMCHVQRSGDGNWGCRNLAKWNGHHSAIYHGAVVFFGVQNVKWAGY